MLTAIRQSICEPMARRNPIPLLRTIGQVEGVSFLVLLLIAMPLKYAAGMPLAVKVVGWAHGVLFVAFLATLAWTMVAARWPIVRGALVLAAALLPFGPFVLDRRMKVYIDEFEHAAAVTSSAGRPPGSRT